MLFRSMKKGVQTIPKHHRANTKLLTSLKYIVQKDHPISELQTKTHERDGKNKWQLATFTCPEQLAKMKEKNEHEEMLRKELKKFRTEIEMKFRSSETNKAYKFPRNCFIEKIESSNNSDCIIYCNY